MTHNDVQISSPSVHHLSLGLYELDYVQDKMRLRAQGFIFSTETSEACSMQLMDRLNARNTSNLSYLN